MINPAIRPDALKPENTGTPMKLGVSILFKAYADFHNNLSTTLGCPTGCRLPETQF
jgi:hypothetical protein